MVRHPNGAAETDAGHGHPHREYEETRKGNSPAGVQELQVDVVRTSDVLKPVTYNRPLQNLLPNCGEGLHSHSCGDTTSVFEPPWSRSNTGGGETAITTTATSTAATPAVITIHPALLDEGDRQSPNPRSPRRLPPETH